MTIINFFLLFFSLCACVSGTADHLARGEDLCLSRKSVSTSPSASAGTDGRTSVQAVAPDGVPLLSILPWASRAGQPGNCMGREILLVMIARKSIRYLCCTIKILTQAYLGLHEFMKGFGWVYKQRGSCKLKWNKSIVVGCCCYCLGLINIIENLLESACEI